MEIYKFTASFHITLIQHEKKKTISSGKKYYSKLYFTWKTAAKQIKSKGINLGCSLVYMEYPCFHGLVYLLGPWNLELKWNLI